MKKLIIMLFCGACAVVSMHAFDENDVMGNRYYRPIYQKILSKKAPLRQEYKQAMKQAKQNEQDLIYNREQRKQDLMKLYPELKPHQAADIITGRQHRLEDDRENARVRYYQGIDRKLNKWYGRGIPTVRTAPSTYSEEALKHERKARELSQNWIQDSAKMQKENPNLDSDLAHKIKNKEYYEHKLKAYEAMDTHLRDSKAFRPGNYMNWIRAKMGYFFY